MQGGATSGKGGSIPATGGGMPLPQNAMPIPMGGTPANMGSSGNGIFDWSSDWLRGSAGATGQAANMFANAGGDPAPALRAINQAHGMFNSPNMGSMQAHLASTPRAVRGAGYGPVTFGGHGYGAQGYDASKVANLPNISDRMGDYYNPYTNEVINQAQQDIGRQLQTQLGNVGADASSAGAFGGSRHGLVEAETNRAALDTIGRTSADLRNQMFDTAARLASQDIGNLMGTRLANQQATNQARQFGAAETNRARQFTASNKQQAAATNAAARNKARQFAASSRQQANLVNADMQKHFNTLNAGATNQARQWNAANQQDRRQGVMDLASMLQNQQGLDAQTAMQQAQGVLSAASGLGHLSQSAFGMGSDITNRQMQQGTMGQALRQQLLDQAQSMFGQYTGQPQNLLNLRLASVGANPLTNAGTTNQSYQPGWGELFGNLLSAGGQAAGAYFGASDRRLKTDIVEIGNTKTGIPLYRYRFKGDNKIQIGPMAQDLQELRPDAVREIDGILHVDYSKVE